MALAALCVALVAWIGLCALTASHLTLREQVRAHLDHQRRNDAFAQKLKARARVRAEGRGGDEAA